MSNITVALACFLIASVLINLVQMLSNGTLQDRYRNLAKSFDDMVVERNKVRDDLYDERKRHGNLKVSIFNYINFVEALGTKVPNHLRDKFRGIIGLSRVETYATGGVHVIDGKGRPRFKIGDLDPKPEDRTSVRFEQTSGPSPEQLMEIKRQQRLQQEQEDKEALQRVEENSKREWAQLQQMLNDNKPVEFCGSITTPAGTSTHCTTSSHTHDTSSSHSHSSSDSYSSSCDSSSSSSSDSGSCSSSCD